MPHGRAGLPIACALVLIVDREPMRNFGDPLGLLPGIGALLSSGTIALDGFGQERTERLGCHVREIGGQQCHFVPDGTALLALPEVAVANLDSDGESDVGVDRAIPDAMIWIAFPLWSVALHRIARRYLAETHAMAASALFVWSTMLSSSGLTGLFPHDDAIVFALFAIERAPAVADAPGTARAGAARRWHRCLPTFPAPAFLPPVLAFVALQGWRAALYGAWLPPYFVLSRTGAV